MSWLHYWLCLVCVLVEGRRTLPEGTCSFSRVFKMLGADCSDQNLVNIPSTVAMKKVEVLDATFNRIRILRNTSFLDFDYLRFLYLADNSISLIEAGAFDPVPQLEVLDLSLNSLRELPPRLPQALRRLYLAENLNLDNFGALERSGSVPKLNFLSLAECSIIHLPQLAELPYLEILNLSGNPLEELTVRQLVSFCHLQNVTLPMNLAESPHYTTSCDCVNVAKWFRDHSIFSYPKINCTVYNETECLSGNRSAEEAAFRACEMAYQELATTRWLVIAGVVVVVLSVAVLCVLWCLRCRQSGSKTRRPPANISTTIDIDDPRQGKLLTQPPRERKF